MKYCLWLVLAIWILLLWKTTIAWAVALGFFGALCVAVVVVTLLYSLIVAIAVGGCIAILSYLRDSAKRHHTVPSKSEDTKDE